MSDAPRADDRTARPEWIALLAWLLVAGILRFVGLERWSLWGDEAHTLSDTLDLEAGELRASVRAYPVLYLVELAALRMLGPLSSPEFALRVFPAASSALAVGVLFWSSRPLLDRRSRHCLAFLASSSPWLLYHAQFARFYGPLLLLSAVALLYFLRGLRSGSRRELALGAAAVFAAGLTHPTGWTLFAGLLATVPLALRASSARSRVRLLLVSGLVVLGLALAVVLFLEDFTETVVWKLMKRDAGADSVFDLLQGVVYNYGLAPTALAGLGFLGLWSRDRRLAAELTLVCGLVGGLVFALAALGTAVEQRYLVPVVPALLIVSAVQLSELVATAERRVAFGGLAVFALVAAPVLPSLVSHYADGNRHDIRGACEYLERELRPQDAIVAENHYLVQRYLPELPPERLLEAPPQFGDPEGILKLRALEEQLAAQGGRLWVVVPTFYLDLGGDERAFYEWVTGQGTLQHELHRPRLDYHQNRLQVFLVDPARAEAWIPVEDELLEDEESPPDTSPD